MYSAGKECVCVCVCLVFELRSSSGHTSVWWWWSLRCTHTLPEVIYPSLANQHNVLHTSFQHLMQERVVFCVPKHSTIKPRGEPFSAAPALIQQTWCAQILITSTHMCALLHHANDARHVPRCCSHLLLPEKTKAGTGHHQSMQQPVAGSVYWMHAYGYTLRRSGWLTREINNNSKQGQCERLLWDQAGKGEGNCKPEALLWDTHYVWWVWAYIKRVKLEKCKTVPAENPDGRRRNQPGHEATARVTAPAFIKAW